MDLSKIKTLIDFVGQSRISELTVTDGGTSVRITRAAAGPATESPLEPSAPSTLSIASEPSETATGAPSGLAAASSYIAAPLFGILHRAPSPGSAPFVEVGHRVEAGQNLCIIEAMKVFNMVSAPRAGTIARIGFADGAEVELGDVLMEIE
jgi:acetyl-CoA carboxylase biotin carboxyl carrier protein